MNALRLFPPSAEEIAAVRAAHRDAPFSYEPVGSPAVPPGWFDNRGGTELGRGAAVFERAKAAMRAWEMFDLGWVRAFPEPGRPVAVGAPIAVVSRTWGFSTLLVTRIVAVWDEPRRFAFSYGTTRQHVEHGEETFSVTWHADDRVTYDVWSYSRIAHPLVTLAAPLARHLQRTFIRDSCARMRRAVGP